YDLETVQNQTENDIFGSQQNVFGGPVTTTGTDTEQYSGPYVICSWIEGPNQGEVDAAAVTPIYVGTPPPPLRLPDCVVPSVRGGNTVSSVKHALSAHHCTPRANQARVQLQSPSRPRD